MKVFVLILRMQLVVTGAVVIVVVVVVVGSSSNIEQSSTPLFSTHTGSTIVVSTLSSAVPRTQYSVL